MHDPIATFWTVMVAAVTYTILGSAIGSVIYLIVTGNLY